MLQALGRRMQPVLISGAGLSGLLLAHSLRRSQIPFEVYERDSAGSARTQGYRIRLSQQGLDAIRTVLDEKLHAEFRHACSDNGSGQILAYDAVTMEPKPGPPGSGPPRPSAAGEKGTGAGPGGGPQVLGVDRAFLRNLLLRDIPVHFGKAVVGYDLLHEGADQGVRARFSDGTASPTGFLLVGADGIYSKIAKQLTKGGMKVYDTGARMIHGSAPRHTFTPLARGRYAAFSIQDTSAEDGKEVAMITNVRDEPSATHFGFVLVGGPGTFSAPNDDFSVAGQAAVDIAVALTRNWAEGLRPILAEQSVPDAAFLKMSTSDPRGVVSWANEARVTLMGDAVHAMTPGKLCSA